MSRNHGNETLALARLHQGDCGTQEVADAIDATVGTASKALSRLIASGRAKQVRPCRGNRPAVYAAVKKSLVADREGIVRHRVTVVGGVSSSEPNVAHVSLPAPPWESEGAGA